jgi:DNA-nicking Smr family endonuclease
MAAGAEMKRPLKPEDLKVWSVVAATVHPLVGRATPKAFPPPEPAIPAAPLRLMATELAKPPALRRRDGLDPIEPGRKRRIVRERDPIGARLDLHGLDQDRARARLEAFLHQAWDEGIRSVLVITGKGVTGDGVLRRQAPEWLAAPHLARIVAGISEAHRHHGGEGALYVALKRKPRG